MGGTNTRETVIGRDTVGDPVTTTITGFEAGAAFSYETVREFHPSGMPETINPDGYNSTDVTEYADDPSRGGLLPLTRTDPIIGATASTAYEYDPFNRVCSR